VVAACLSLAKDGTRAAIEAVCETAARYTDFESALGPLRRAVEPYDTVGPEYRAPSLGARRPSRLHAIEELPVALGMLVVSGGEHRHAVLGSVNYGRDCDSIATMAGALAGALGSPVPDEWAKTVAEASRLDLTAPAHTLAEVAREVFARDVARRRAHEAAFAGMRDGAAGEVG
jgi:ADP-ribosylglycohydrolase